MGDEFDPDEIYEVCDYDFEMVKWTLDELNVPPEYALMVAAVNHRAQPNYEMMEYLHAKGCPKDVPEGMHAQEEEDHLDVYQAAAWFQGPKAIKCIRWLHSRVAESSAYVRGLRDGVAEPGARDGRKHECSNMQRQTIIDNTIIKNTIQ